jgi:hypothetical protein
LESWAGSKSIAFAGDTFRKADRSLLTVPGGDHEDIVDDKEWETGQSQFEVAQIELPGAESDDEDDDNDLYEGEDSFHFLLSSPLRQVWMGNGFCLMHVPKAGATSLV